MRGYISHATQQLKEFVRRGVRSHYLSQQQAPHNSMLIATAATWLTPPRSEMGAAECNNKGVSLHMLGLSAESIACYDAALELNRNFDLPFLNKVQPWES